MTTFEYTARSHIRKPPMSVVLFNPNAVATVLWTLFTPFAALGYLIPPVLLLAFGICLGNWHILTDDIRRVFFSISFLQSLVLGMLTSNLLGKTAQAIVMVGEGIPPQQFGIRLLFGVLPRFFISNGQIRSLPFDRQRPCYAAPLLTRLMMFAGGIALWSILRTSGSGLANVMLAFGITGLGAFVFTANPIWRADGYRWVTAYFRMPQLRENAFGLLQLYVTERRRPEAMPATQARNLVLYAVASITYTAFLIGTVTSSIAISLEAQFRGTGVVIFALILAMALLFFLSIAGRRRDRAQNRATRKEQRMAQTQNKAMVPPQAPAPITPRSSPLMRSDKEFKRVTRDLPPEETAREAGAPDPDLEAILTPPSPAIPPEDDALFDLFDEGLAEDMPNEDQASTGPKSVPVPPPPAVRHGQETTVAPARPASQIDTILKPSMPRKARPSLWRRLLIWVVLLGGLYYLGQQPYPFTVGGEFIIQSVERTQVRARTDGEIIQLNASEGDWVRTGTTLAVLSKWDEERDIEVLSAELARQQAELTTLTAGPKAEEISLAEQVRAAADAELTAAAAALARAEQLFSSGTIARTALDEARTQMLIATADLEQAEAALALLKAPVLDSEIEAARAAIRRTEGELQFKQLQLEHTNIKAVTDGQIVSDLSGVSVGTFLREGDLFAELADNRTVLAEIEVPETEIDEVTPGATVALRPWSTPDREIEGVVKRVAPAAEERAFGRIIRVTVEVPNESGTLAGNMTGFGKIAVDERPAWRVFTRVFVRFFEVEIWSWLP